jgi:hypothetical protein
MYTLDDYIQSVEELDPPRRSTPENVLQAWIIKKAIGTDYSLSFAPSIKFITSELAFYNKENKKVVSDIIGYNIDTRQLVIMEIKSARHWSQLLKQLIAFEAVVIDNYPFFKQLLEIHGYLDMDKEPQKVMVWPHSTYAKTSNLKVHHNIHEFTYQPDDDDGYMFFDQSNK